MKMTSISWGGARWLLGLILLIQVVTPVNSFSRLVNRIYSTLTPYPFRQVSSLARRHLSTVTRETTSSEIDIVLEKVSYFAMLFYTSMVESSSFANTQSPTSTTSDTFDFDLSNLLRIDPQFKAEEVASYILECQSVGALKSWKVTHDSSSLTLHRRPDRSMSRPPLNRLILSQEQCDLALAYSKSFIKAMIADFAVCPFTRSADKAGVPQGLIRYTVSQASTIDEAFFDFWSEVYAMMSSPISEASTVILVFANPSFLRSFEEFQLLTDVLDRGLDDKATSSFPGFKLGGLVNNVYFHPEYRFVDRDEQVMFLFDEVTGEVIGTSNDLVSPISYARRSPFPFINILRSDMVQASQSGIPEGKIFNANKVRLEAVGSPTLQRMLDARDWSTLPPPLSIKMN